MNIIFGLYAGFGVSIFIFLMAVFMLIKASRGKKVKKISEQITQNALQDSIQVLEQTRKESEEIIEDALRKAQSTISSAEFISKTAQQEFDHEIKEAEDRAVASFAQDFQKNEAEFQKLFYSIQQQFENQAQRTMQMLEGVVQKEADSFRQALQDQTINAEKQMQGKVQEDFVKISQEIENYKRAQIAGINQTINTIAKEIIGEVLRKSITPQDHSALILASFEKAFQEGFIQKPMQQNVSN